MRVEEMRGEFQRLIHHRPFQPFLINLENGDRLEIERPENIAFDPTEGGRTRFYVITRSLACAATLESVSTVVHQDIGETVDS